LFLFYCLFVCLFVFSKEKTKDLNLVILADMDLLSLPLEAITQLKQIPSVSSVSRDFSLQVLKHRVARSIPDDAGMVEIISKCSGRCSKPKMIFFSIQ